MEEQLSSLAVTHLLQHTLRSLCIHDNSQWVYAVFWRILPRNYPPPKWEGHGAYDRSRGNRRNWILVWEDGFCNFAALSSSSSSSPTSTEINPSGDHCSSGPSVYGHVSSFCDNQHHHHHDDQFNQFQGLQPELFFKMSHEIYNYGEGLIGKVAADHSHKWIYKEPNDQEINFLSAWHNSADSHPRTWEAQFQSGIKTIALIAVREGVIQLGATHKVIEDLSYVVLLRKKLSYIESIPGVLLPHPSSSPYPYYNNNNINNNNDNNNNNMISNNHNNNNNNNHYIVNTPPDHAWHFQGSLIAPQNHDQFCHTDYHQFNNLPLKITPSMSSLEALLSKLPSVVPPPPQPHVAAPPLVQFPMAGVSPHHHHQNFQRPNDSGLVGLKKAVAKDEVDEEEGFGLSGNSNATFAIAHHHHHQDHNVASASGPANSGF